MPSNYGGGRWGGRSGGGRPVQDSLAGGGVAGAVYDKDVRDYLGGDASMLPDFVEALTSGSPDAMMRNATAGYITEAANVQGETNRRHGEQVGLLQSEQQRASQPTLTDQDINRMYGQAADQAAIDANKLIRSLRSHLGEAGVRGGTAAGMATQVELERLGQLSGAKRDLRIFKANADAQDRLNRWQRAFQLGQVVGEEPSAFLSDALGNLMSLRLGQQGIKAQMEAAKMAAKSSEQAGLMGGLGGIFQGLLGAFL